MLAKGNHLFFQTIRCTPKQDPDSLHRKQLHQTSVKKSDVTIRTWAGQQLGRTRSCRRRCYLHPRRTARSISITRANPMARKYPALLEDTVPLPPPNRGTSKNDARLRQTLTESIRSLPPAKAGQHRVRERQKTLTRGSAGSCCKHGAKHASPRYHELHEHQASP
jgi:hypothetical protein